MNDLTFIHGHTGGPEEWEEVPVPVTEQQRWRILDATTRVLYEHGYATTTVAHIVREARVSRRTFYENFENKEHVYLATFSNAVECMASAISDRFAGETWTERTASAFGELSRLLVEHPEAAHTCLVEVGAAGAEGQSRRADALGLCRDGLRTVVDSAGARQDPCDPMAIELAVAGLHGVLLERLRNKDGEGASAAMPSIALNVLSPLVGLATAAEVAARIASLPASAERAGELGVG